MRGVRRVVHPHPSPWRMRTQHPWRDDLAIGSSHRRGAAIRSRGAARRARLALLAQHRRRIHRGVGGVGVRLRMRMLAETGRVLSEDRLASGDGVWPLFLLWLRFRNRFLLHDDGVSRQLTSRAISTVTQWFLLDSDAVISLLFLHAGSELALARRNGSRFLRSCSCSSRLLRR